MIINNYQLNIIFTDLILCFDDQKSKDILYHIENIINKQKIKNIDHVDLYRYDICEYIYFIKTYDFINDVYSDEINSIYINMLYLNIFNEEVFDKLMSYFDNFIFDISKINLDSPLENNINILVTKIIEFDYKNIISINSINYFNQDNFHLLEKSYKLTKVDYVKNFTNDTFCYKMFLDNERFMLIDVSRLNRLNFNLDKNYYVETYKVEKK